MVPDNRGRSSDRPLVVSNCIGCGRVDMHRECTGECRDVRLTLRRADDPAAEPVETWLCTACGRIEAPQPCLGICVRRQVEMVVLPSGRSVDAPDPAAVRGADA